MVTSPKLAFANEVTDAISHTSIAAALVSIGLYPPKKVMALVVTLSMKVIMVVIEIDGINPQHTTRKVHTMIVEAADMVMIAVINMLVVEIQTIKDMVTIAVINT